MEMAGQGKGPVISMKTMAPQQVNEKCMTCHDRARQANWHGGVHERRGLACTTCHSIHAFQSQRAQLKTPRAAETCYGCHPQVRAQGMRARVTTPFAKGSSTAEAATIRIRARSGA